MFIQFYNACISDNTEEVRRLLADPQVVPSEFAFQEACHRGYTRVVSLLLKDGRVNPGADNNKALMYAVQFKRTEVVRLLLSDPRVDPAADGNKALKYAIQFSRHPETVQLLLSDPRVNPVDHYHLALVFGNREILNLLDNDLRIAMNMNDHHRIEAIVGSRTFVRPPIGSLVYTLGNAATREYLREMLIQQALIRTNAMVSNKIPFDIAKMISRYGKKRKSKKKFRKL
jgi:hypothetical protein